MSSTYCSNKLESQEIDCAVNPTNIAYFIHPTTKIKCNVVHIHYLDCTMCHSHKTYLYKLDNGQSVHYCECIEGGGQWVFSSKQLRV